VSKARYEPCLRGRAVVFIGGGLAMTFAMANAAAAPAMTTVIPKIGRGFAAEYALGVKWLEDDPSLPPMYQGP
jgi:hypothetical protein